jgi:hypothetical protein
MKLKVKLELPDYRKWNMEFFYGGWRGKTVIAAALVLLASTAFFICRLGIKALSDNPQVIFVMALGLLFLLLMPVSIFMQSKKVFSTDKFLQEEQEYEFGDAGFTVSSPHGRSEIPWNMVYKVKHTKNFISIYLSNIRAFVIPARLLGQEELKALQESLKSPAAGKKGDKAF